jgi:hypothetical protein
VMEGNGLHLVSPRARSAETRNPGLSCELECWNVYNTNKIVR